MLSYEEYFTAARGYLDAGISNIIERRIVLGLARAAYGVALRDVCAALMKAGRGKQRLPPADPFEWGELHARKLADFPVERDRIITAAALYMGVWYALAIK